MSSNGVDSACVPFVLNDVVPDHDHIEVLATAELAVAGDVAGAKAVVFDRFRSFLLNTKKVGKRPRQPIDIDHILFSEAVHLVAPNPGQTSAAARRQARAIKAFVEQNTSGTRCTGISMHVMLLPIVFAEFCGVVITDQEMLIFFQRVAPVCEAQTRFTLPGSTSASALPVLCDGAASSSAHVAATALPETAVVEFILPEASRSLHDLVVAQVTERCADMDRSALIDALVLSEVANEKGKIKFVRAQRECRELRDKYVLATDQIQHLRVTVKDIATETQFRPIGLRNVSILGKYHLGFVRSHGNVSARTSIAMVASAEWSGALKDYHIITRFGKTITQKQNGKDS